MHRARQTLVICRQSALQPNRTTGMSPLAFWVPWCSRHGEAWSPCLPGKERSEDWRSDASFSRGSWHSIMWLWYVMIYLLKMVISYCHHSSCYDMLWLLWYVMMFGQFWSWILYIFVMYASSFNDVPLVRPSTCAGHPRHHQLQFRHQWPLEGSISVGRDGRRWCHPHAGTIMPSDTGLCTFRCSCCKTWAKWIGFEDRWSVCRVCPRWYVAHWVSIFSILLSNICGLGWFGLVEGLRICADAISHNSAMAAMGACKSWAMASEVQRSMQRSISSDVFSSWA